MADPKTKPPIKEAEEKYLKNLNTTIELWNKKKEAKEKERIGQKAVEQFKICQLAKAAQTRDLYKSLKFYIADGTAKEAALIKDFITAMDTQSTALGAAMGEAITALKDIRKKMTEAVEIACRLPRNIGEEKRCNLDIYNKLQNQIDGIYDTIKKDIKPGTSTSFDKITLATTVLTDLIGIQNLSKPAGLMPFSEALIASSADFKADVDANVTSSVGKVAAVEAELVAEQEKLSQIRVDQAGVDATYVNFPADHPTRSLQGQSKLSNYILNPNCDNNKEKVMAKIQAICEGYFLEEDYVEIIEEEKSKKPSEKQKTKELPSGSES